MDPRQDEKSELSAREIEILRLVATGASNKEIAQALFISTNTVKVHLHNIFSKIDASSRTEAAMYAIKQGLVTGQSPTEIESVEPTPDVLPTRAKPAVSQWIGIAIVLIFAVTALIVLLDRTPIGAPGPTVMETPTTAAPRWIERAPLPSSRSGLALVAYEGSLFAVGGRTNDDVTGIAERYDPASNTWMRLSSKPTPVSEISAVVIGGKIYFPGGTLASGEVTDILEIYDPREDKWTRGAPVPRAVSAYALAAFEGRLFQFGGWDGNTYLDSVYIYEPGVDTWTESSAMPTARGHLGAAVSGRKIFVMGGYDGEKALPTNEIFVPDLLGTSADPWQVGQPLPEGKYAMGVTSLADMIYVVGGSSSPSVRYPFMVYVAQNSEWQLVETSPQVTLVNPGVASLNGGVCAVGGIEGDVVSSQNLVYQAVYTLSFPIVTK